MSELTILITSDLLPTMVVESDNFVFCIEKTCILEQKMGANILTMAALTEAIMEKI